MVPSRYPLSVPYRVASMGVPGPPPALMLGMPEYAERRHMKGTSSHARREDARVLIRLEPVRAFFDDIVSGFVEASRAP